MWDVTFEYTKFAHLIEPISGSSIPLFPWFIPENTVHMIGVEYVLICGIPSPPFLLSFSPKKSFIMENILIYVK